VVFAWVANCRVQRSNVISIDSLYLRTTGYEYPTNGALESVEINRGQTGRRAAGLRRSGESRGPFLMDISGHRITPMY
jgi:hypothetical protein